jgi:hypothetical protein
MVNDTKSVDTKVIKTTNGINERNIHIIPGRVNIGMNAEIVVRVQIIIGDLNSFSAIKVAVFGLYPCFTFSAAHSTMMIIVSIAIQKASTNAKVVIWFKVSQMNSTTINANKKASGKIKVAIADSLNHTKNIRARNTSIIVIKAD